MRRPLIVAVLLVALIGVASADWWTSLTKPFGNAAGNTVRGSAADTLVWTSYVGVGGFRNSLEFLWRIRADSVVDTLPSLTLMFQYKPDYLFGVNTWTTVHIALDSVNPLDGSKVLTWPAETTTYFMPRIAAFEGCSIRAIIAGVDTYQLAKACSLEWRVKK